MNRLIAPIRAWNKRRLARRALRKTPDYKLGWDWAKSQVFDLGKSAIDLAASFDRPKTSFQLGVFESASSIVTDDELRIW